MPAGGLVNVGLLWAAVVASASGMVYVTTNFASAADVERIEYRLIKQELRDLRRELDHENNEEIKERIREDIEDVIDDLCMIAPDDRECKS
jgi:deoxyribodipyrimidine photolyase